MKNYDQKHYELTVLLESNQAKIDGLEMMYSKVNNKLFETEAAQSTGRNHICNNAITELNKINTTKKNAIFFGIKGSAKMWKI